MKVFYSKHGIPISDFDALNYAKRSYMNKQDVITSSEIVIQAFRVLVCNGTIDCKDVVFIYEGKNIAIDSNGDFDIQPSGFCDTYRNFLMELV